MSKITCTNSSCGAVLEGVDLNHCPKCGSFLPKPEAADVTDPLLGQVILHGKYRILSILGEGGMGKVYLAEQKLGAGTRKVAIKTLQPELAGDPEIIARFLREADTVGQLEHPNTIKVWDAGKLDEHNNLLFLVMEYIQGQNLAHLLTAGPLDAVRAERIMSQICGSLAEAHERGIVHRDLKPENIYLVQKGARGDFVKVLDFGIAKRSEAADEKEAKLTRQGMVLGTPPYMSPEQFTGQTLDGRSDIYALAVIGYEMLTGQLPFTANTPWEWATKHLTQPPIPFEQQPSSRATERHKRAVYKALAKNRDERQPNVLQFLEDFTGNSASAADWTNAGTSMTNAGSSGTEGLPPPPVMPTGPGAQYGGPQTQSGQQPTGPGGFHPQSTPNPFLAQPSQPGYVPAPTGTGFAAVPPSVNATGGAFGQAGQYSNPGMQNPYTSVTGMAPGNPYQQSTGSAPPRKKSNTGLIVGLILGVLALGGGALALNTFVFNSDDTPTNPVANTDPNNPNVNPNNPPQVPGVNFPNNNVPPVPTGIPPVPQPIPVPNPPPVVINTPPTPPPELAPPATPPLPPFEPPGVPPALRPSGGSPGEAAVSRGIAALSSNNFNGAFSAMNDARRSNAPAAAMGRLRSEIHRRGQNQIDNLILGGNCRGAQGLFRQLREAGMNPASGSFGDACQAP